MVQIPSVLATMALAATVESATSNCFPYGDATLPGSLAAPNVTLDQWWCPQSMAYGFQGFSYPMEDDDCSSSSYSVEQMSGDFAQMKKDFGASIVRMYYPVCTEAKVFGNALEAAYANNMAIIFQVWTNFGDGVSSYAFTPQRHLPSPFIPYQFPAPLTRHYRTSGNSLNKPSTIHLTTQSTPR